MVFSIPIPSFLNLPHATLNCFISSLNKQVAHCDAPGAIRDIVKDEDILLEIDTYAFNLTNCVLQISRYWGTGETTAGFIFCFENINVEAEVALLTIKWEA